MWWGLIKELVNRIGERERYVVCVDWNGEPHGSVFGGPNPKKENVICTSVEIKKKSERAERIMVLGSVER